MAETKRFLGCIPTPPNQLARAKWVGRGLLAARASGQLPPPPPNFDGTCGVKDWDIAGNDRWGTCVTAEEGNYKKIIAPATGGKELDIPGDNIVAWARQEGGMRGMFIPDAMTRMQTRGIKDASGKPHTIGKHGAIDWENPLEVKLAIHYCKALKIGVAHSQVPQAHRNGWVLTGARADRRVDHCVGIYGYGSAEYLARVCALDFVPEGLDAKTFCVLMYTWGTIGIVDWDSFVAITGEAWVRITDPDRFDRDIWDPVAESDFEKITGTPNDTGAVASAVAPATAIILDRVPLDAGICMLRQGAGQFSEPISHVTIPTGGNYTITFQPCE
jgi:hypothetical protein